METRFCKRCLLKDMSEDDFFESIYAYIERLPEEQKAEKSVYEARLSRCTACDALQNGMCALCGCFVEVRAAKKHMHCAKSAEIW